MKGNEKDIRNNEIKCKTSIVLSLMVDMKGHNQVTTGNNGC